MHRSRRRGPLHRPRPAALPDADLGQALKPEQVLDVRCGAEALRTLQDHGLQASGIRVMVGASGGPKWLVLKGLDDYLVDGFFADCDHPIHLLGSSIGTWRFACYAQKDPRAALQRFADAYVGAQLLAKPTPADVTKVCRDILNQVLGQNGVSEILQHPLFFNHIVTVRGRHLITRDARGLLLLGLGLGALANLIDRRLLHYFFERVVFARPGPSARFHDLTDIATRIAPLESGNLFDALMASASIPGVLQPVRGIAEAPAGTYYDGGVLDYHFDIPFHDRDGIVFYPHFYPHIKPGWFDKALHWRGHTEAHYANVLLVAPSREFVAGLPYGKIPDRKDFVKMSDPDRRDYWRKVLDESRRLGDAFHELRDRQDFAAVAKPL